MSAIIGYNKKTKKYYVGSQTFNSKSERDAYLDSIKTLAKRIKKLKSQQKTRWKKFGKKMGLI